MGAEGPPQGPVPLDLRVPGGKRVVAITGAGLLKEAVQGLLGGRWGMGYGEFAQIEEDGGWVAKAERSGGPALLLPSPSCRLSSDFILSLYCFPCRRPQHGW